MCNTTDYFRLKDEGASLDVLLEAASQMAAEGDGRAVDALIELTVCEDPGIVADAGMELYSLAGTDDIPRLLEVLQSDTCNDLIISEALANAVHPYNTHCDHTIATIHAMIHCVCYGSDSVVKTVLSVIDDYQYGAEVDWVLGEALTKTGRGGLPAIIELLRQTNGDAVADHLQAALLHDDELQLPAVDCHAWISDDAAEGLLDQLDSADLDAVAAVIRRIGRPVTDHAAGYFHFTDHSIRFDNLNLIRLFGTPAIISLICLLNGADSTARNVIRARFPDASIRPATEEDVARAIFELGPISNDAIYAILNSTLESLRYTVTHILCFIPTGYIGTSFAISDDPFGARDVVRALTVAADDTSARVRAMAAMGLGRHRDRRSACAVVLRMTKDPDPRVRLEAVSSVGAFLRDSRVARDTVFHVASDVHEEQPIREIAIRLCNNQVPPLLDWFDNPELGYLEPE